MQDQKRLTKGFVFTFESIIALILFALMLFSIHQENNPTLKELIILQQSSDIIRVWSQIYPTEEEMIKDSKTIFSNNVSLKINGKEVLTCEGKNKLSQEGILLDKMLNENKIIVTICY